ncbi:MAG: aerobic carbon-monoxide dehydrogenase medium subunit, partial [Actinomycetota bacterium]|nr:aerobic carbon-monoxide dehydrogenase medium subunit [Actinomycetota bacterium]
MKPPAFRYERPETMAEALALLAEHGDVARPLAGGQSLVPMLNLRLATPGVVVDLNGLAAPGKVESNGRPGPGGVALHAVALDDGHLVVGALTRQRVLELSPAAAGIGALADGLPLVGHVATRNRGTVGGSIAHADPAAELPLALVALGGSVVVEGPDGRREIPADDLFAGFLTTSLRPGELVVEVRFPTPRARDGSALLEVAQRHGDFPLAAVAVSLLLDGDGRVGNARVAVGAVADRPLLLPEAAEALVSGAGPEEAGRLAATLVDPGGSLHAPADYQRHLVSVLVARAVTRARHRASAQTPAPTRPPIPGAAAQTAAPTRAPIRAGAGPVRPATSAAASAPEDLGTDRPAKPARSVPRSAARAGNAAGPAGSRCTVNGRVASLDGVPDRRLLSDFLRHDLGLRGTHVGCEHGVCGACTVRVDGAAVRSCLLLARQVDGAEIETVEGLAADDEARTLHPLQEAFRRHFALQCGFCTAGILMAAAERLDEAAAGAGQPDEDEIRRLLSGHLCRCTGYEPIVAAIAEVAAAERPAVSEA